MYISMKELERTLKALANRRRLAIIRSIKEAGELSVSEIAERIHLSLKATSKHLGILTAADIVEREQRSLRMIYSLGAKQHNAAKGVIHIL